MGLHRAAPEDELLRIWGGAGAESLWLMGQLFVAGTLRVPSAKGWTLEVLPGKKNGTGSVPTTSVLYRLQQNLRGQTTESKIAQDTSLQIVGCPGAMREIETVLHSILHNMQVNPALRLTDIAVLVTDMNKYRPMIQSVFERPRPRVAYNLMDYPAAAVSTFGQGFLGMLDLALESFTRTRVLEVLQNPCFLERLGVERAQALNWVAWAKELGVFQGWDAAEKKERGYAASSLFGWQLGLRRCAWESSWNPSRRLRARRRHALAISCPLPISIPKIARNLTPSAGPSMACCPRSQNFAVKS